jgi:two-component system, NtrC family, response regulator AtoC
VRANTFREDLLFRLNVVPLRVPPLRDRVTDIEPLVKLFLNLYTERYGMAEVSLEPALLELLKTNAWPGNVRELENTIARLLALTPDEILTVALWRSLQDPTSSSMPQTGSGSTGSDPGPAFPLRARIEAFERSIVAAEFQAATHNQSETARRLGISRPALIERLNKYRLLEK